MVDKISNKQVEEALIRSGYLLESRLESILNEDGYYVDANSAYLDSETGKSRELDLYAMGRHQVGSHEYEFIFSVLLIEAVNNPQPIAFLTKESNISFLHHEDIKVVGLPVKIPDKDSHSGWICLSEYLQMNEYHHYCQGRVATQYCSFTQKRNEAGNKEWMAFHDEAHFNNFRTLSVAVEYYKNYLYRGWNKDSTNNLNLEFHYPVVVLQGELLEVRQDNGKVNVQSVDHIQYRRTSIVDSREINYQIDVVTENYFPEFLKIVRTELENTADLLDKHYASVCTAINTIIKLAKQARTFAEIKAAFDFDLRSGK